MKISKGNLQEDENYFFFDVEASNENLDLEGQKILQRALLGSKDYFLSNGVVTKDHLHKRVEHGQQITDEQYVIGEPVSVYTEGKSTRVRGKLYKNNEYARKFIDLLRVGSTRVKASVGGIIPKVVKNMKDGTEKVVSVLWNDLALTIAPVNYTVSPAAGVMAKSLNSLEFVKSLSVGYETDSSAFTGGRALQKEDIEHDTVDRSGRDYEGAIAALEAALANGKVKTLEESKDFLDHNFGFSAAASLAVIREISKHNEFLEVLPMAKTGNLFANLIENIKKSMGGGKGGKSNNDDVGDQDDGEGYNNDDDDEDGEEFIDAREVIKALTDEVEALKEGQKEIVTSLKALSEFKKSIGESMIALIEANANTPLPRRGVGGIDAAGLQKGGVGGKGGHPIRPHRQLTAQDRDELLPILTKAVAGKEIDIIDCGKLETQINKSIRDPNFQIEPRLLSWLETKLATNNT
jgi:hypothetical protein